MNNFDNVTSLIYKKIIYPSLFSLEIVKFAGLTHFPEVNPSLYVFSGHNLHSFSIFNKYVLSRFDVNPL